MDKCKAIDCNTNERCNKKAKYETETSDGPVYCKKHYKKLQQGIKICYAVNPGSPRSNITPSTVRRNIANVASPRISVSSPKSFNVSRMSYESESESESETDEDNDSVMSSESESDSENEGIIPLSKKSKKKYIRPKSVYKRAKEEPDFKLKDGAAKQLQVIDTTDNVMTALIKLKNFKLEVFGSDINVKGDDNMEEKYKKYSVTEKVVNETARVLSKYMTNPMRIELVLSFLYDYDTRDLNVPFSFFGFRSPKNSDVLNQTLASYIKEAVTANKPWTDYPTRDIRYDYEEYDSKVEKARKQIKDYLRITKEISGETALNKMRDDLMDVVERPSFKYDYQLTKLEEYKKEYDKLTTVAKQQTSGKQQTFTPPLFTQPLPSNSAPAALPPFRADTSAASTSFPSNFDNLIDLYGTLKNDIITEDVKSKLKTLRGDIKNKIYNSIKKDLEGKDIKTFKAVKIPTNLKALSENPGNNNLIDNITTFDAPRVEKKPQQNRSMSPMKSRR